MLEHHKAASAYDAANLDAMSAAPRYQAAMRRLVSRYLKLSTTPTGPCIDFGAGQGDYAHALKVDHGLDLEIVCLEPDEALHGHYASHMRRAQTLAELPLEGAQCAYSLNVFEHIIDDAHALRELAMRCTQGALIFVLVPANHSLWTAMDTAVGHIRRYSPQGLRELGLRAGLTIVDEGWFDRTGYMATKLMRLLQRIRPSRQLWQGGVSARQMRIFDSVFRLSEPLFETFNLPFGKNRWVLFHKG